MESELAKKQISTGEKRIDNLQARLFTALSDESNCYITKKRVAIIREISKSQSTIDVEDIWIKLRHSSNISRATIYRIIGILIDCNIIVASKEKLGYSYKITEHR